MKKLWLTGIVLVLLTVFAAGATYTFEEFNFSIDIPDDYLVVTKDDTVNLTAIQDIVGEDEIAGMLTRDSTILYAAHPNTHLIFELSANHMDSEQNFFQYSEAELERWMELYYSDMEEETGIKIVPRTHRTDSVALISGDYYFADEALGPNAVDYVMLSHNHDIQALVTSADFAPVPHVDEIMDTVRLLDDPIGDAEKEAKNFPNNEEEAHLYTAKDSEITVTIPGGWDKETPVQDGGFCATRFYCIDDPSRYVVLITIDILRENALSGLLLRKELEKIDLTEPYVQNAVKNCLECQDWINVQANSEALVLTGGKATMIITTSQGYLIARMVPYSENDQDIEDLKAVTGTVPVMPVKEETHVVRKIILRTLIVLGLTMMICFLPVAIYRLCRRKPHKPFAARVVTVLWCLASGGISLLVLHLLRSPDLIGACGVILWSVPNYFLLARKEKETPLPDELFPEAPTVDKKYS